MASGKSTSMPGRGVGPSRGFFVTALCRSVTYGKASHQLSRRSIIPSSGPTVEVRATPRDPAAERQTRLWTSNRHANKIRVAEATPK